MKQDFNKTFYPNKLQSIKSINPKKKRAYTQHKPISQNSSSEVRLKSSAVSQGPEVSDLIKLVKLLMTKVDGEPQKGTPLILKKNLCQ